MEKIDTKQILELIRGCRVRIQNGTWPVQNRVNQAHHISSPILCDKTAYSLCNHKATQTCCGSMLPFVHLCTLSRVQWENWRANVFSDRSADVISMFTGFNLSYPVNTLACSENVFGLGRFACDCCFLFMMVRELSRNRPCGRTPSCSLFT